MVKNIFHTFVETFNFNCMRFNLFYVFIAIATCLICNSCSSQQDDISGAAYDVLPASVYNALQQKYTHLEDFESGLSRVRAQSGWGLINAKGKEIVKSEYDTIYPLIHNYRIAQKAGKYGLLNHMGKLSILCKYDDCREYLNNGVFAFQLNGKWGFVSGNDEIRVQFKYDDLFQIEDSVFVAKINGYEGLFDFEGKTIIKPEYDRILYKPFRVSGGVSYAKKGGNYAIINSKNELVSKCEYSDFSIPHGSYITIKSFLHDRFCLVNWETGEVTIPYGYEELGDVEEGVLYACKNDKFGYVSPQNEVVIPFQFADAEDFSEGLAMVGVNRGYYRTIWGDYLPHTYYGFIDKSGEFVIKPTFPNQTFNPGSGFKEGLAVMGVENEDNVYPDYYGYIDKTGKWVIKPIYKKADDFVNGVAIVQTRRGYGAINKLGEIIVEPKYDDYEPRGWHKDKLVFEDKDNKQYSYTLDGIALTTYPKN